MARKRINFADIPKVITADVERVFRGACFELFSRIVWGSVVGDPSTWKRPAPKGYTPGAFRGGWQIQINGAGSGASIDEDGSATVGKGLEKLSSYKAGIKVNITNSVPYGPRLEFDAWSPRMPNGVVRINVADWPSIVREIAAGQAKVRG